MSGSEGATGEALHVVRDWCGVSLRVVRDWCGVSLRVVREVVWAIE